MRNISTFQQLSYAHTDTHVRIVEKLPQMEKNIWRVKKDRIHWKKFYWLFLCFTLFIFFTHISQIFPSSKPVVVFVVKSVFEMLEKNEIFAKNIFLRMPFSYFTIALVLLFTLVASSNATNIYFRPLFNWQ